jgi:hypothetical protein
MVLEDMHGETEAITEERKHRIPLTTNLFISLPFLSMKQCNFVSANLVGVPSSLSP